MGKLDGKIAFITGAARGQGRSHAIRMAKEGADIIAVDICAQIDTVPYPLATPEDLAETASAVEATGRRIMASQVDVRDRDALQAAFDKAAGQLGGVDIVVANAGIVSFNRGGDETKDFQDVLDVNLTGVWHTIRVAMPALIDQGRGGSIILTSSTAGLKGMGGGLAGSDAYTASKHALVGLMRSYAKFLGPHFVRVNSVHPAGVNTPMLVNDVMTKLLEEAPESINAVPNAIPVQMVEPADISDAVLWLASDESRYVTGVTLPVDAGFTL